MHGGLPRAVCNNTFSRRPVARLELCARVNGPQNVDTRKLRSQGEMGKTHMYIMSIAMKIESLLVPHSLANMIETGTDEISIVTHGTIQ